MILTTLELRTLGCLVDGGIALEWWLSNQHRNHDHRGRGIFRRRQNDRIGGEFDPASVDIKAVNARLRRIKV